MNIKRIFLGLLIIIWMVTIFWFSNQNGEDSENTSDIITDRVYELIYGKEENRYINLNNKVDDEIKENYIQTNRVSKKNNLTIISYIDDDSYNENETVRYYEEPHEKAVIRYIIRKIAHFTIYFLGGIIIFLFFNTYNIPTWKKFLFTLIFTTIYASCDEMHQRFVEARDGKIEDVILDSLGALTGIFIANMFRRIKALKSKI